jgi:hypothetical protein
MGGASTMKTQRELFEDLVFNRRFIASIGRNPNPPKGFGGFDFISVDCPTKAQLCAKDENGDYVDEVISAMWWGWQQAVTAAAPSATWISEALRLAGEYADVKHGLLARQAFASDYSAEKDAAAALEAHLRVQPPSAINRVTALERELDALRTTAAQSARIADEAMYEVLQGECIPIDTDHTALTMCDEDCAAVNKLDLASVAIRDACAWLLPRGFVALESDESGQYIVVLRRPSDEDSATSEEVRDCSRC